jgi:hypothetical protein
MPLDALETDESRWPIVVHRTVGIPSERQVDAFIARADAILARGEPHVVIFDNLRSGRTPPYMRKRAMDWLSRNGELMGQSCLGTALVFKSAALRFVMSTVMLVSSHPVPHEVCGTMEEAYDWAERLLAQSRAMVG